MTRNMTRKIEEVKQKIFEIVVNKVFKFPPNRQLTDKEIVEVVSLKEPNHTVKFTSKRAQKKYDSVGYFIVKIAIILATVYVSYFKLDTSILQTTLLTLLAMIIMHFSNLEDYPETTEIRFYSDHMTVYKKEPIYSKYITRREYATFQYNKISSIRFSRKNLKFVIIGEVKLVWYEYDEDGTLPTTPFYSYEIDEGMDYFYNIHPSKVNIVEEIEKYTPLQVSLKS